jgi:chromosome segregation ATPase
MASYTVTRASPPSNPAQQDDAPETAEAAEAAAADLDSWRGWIDETRDAIDRGGGDCDDIDAVLATILSYVAAEVETAVAGAEERAGKYAQDVLRETRDSSRKIVTFLRQQREAREKRTAESAALAERLDRIDNAIAAVTRENAALRSSLSACEQNLLKATDMFAKEIGRERSLRRLLDAQRSRPHTQRVASELAKRHAAKVLESATKEKTDGQHRAAS